MAPTDNDFDANPELDEILGDALGIGFKVPTNQQFEYMRMVNRALNYIMDGAGAPTKSTYDLIKEVYRLKGWNDLQLKFPDKFKLDFSPEEKESTVSAYALEAARAKTKVKSEISELAAAIKPKTSQASNISDLIEDRDRNTIEVLKGKIDTTKEAVAERIEAIEAHLGTFEFKVQKMCEALEGDNVDPEKKRAIITALNNKLLARQLEEPIPEYGSLVKFKYPLANAIVARYPNEEDKLGAFLKSLEIFKKNWGTEYPLADFDPQAIKSRPEKKFEQTPTEKNIELLSKALKFDATQKKLLWFFSCNEKAEISKLIKSIQPGTSDDDYIHALSVLLDLKVKDIREALKPEGTLLHFGFLNYDGEAHSYSTDKSLHTLLRKTYTSESDLITGLLGPSPKTELEESDYAYMKGDFMKMAHLLANGLKNIGHTNKPMTLYGPRGTGKTELTAVLAKKLNFPAFMVGVTQKKEGHGSFSAAPSREDRIHDLLRKEFIIKQTGMKAFLIVDEADDLLAQETTQKEGSKVFMNTLLLGMDVPMVVIFNHPERLEESTKRRILPAFQMDYMPLPDRIKAIISKTRKHTKMTKHPEGVELAEQRVLPLAEFAHKLNIAEIDQCIRTSSLWFRGLPPDKQSEDKLFEFIHTQFSDTLKFFNNGIPPVPMAKTSTFHPELFTAEEFLKTCDLMAATFKTNPAAFSGKPFVILGENGTGKKSIAKHIALSITGKHPMELHMDAEHVNKQENAYAMDLEHSARDRKPIIFTAADVFLNNIGKAKDFFARIGHHPQPVIFVANTADMARESLARLSKFRIVRTGFLSEDQIKVASEKILQIPGGIKANELNGNDLTIGDVVSARDELAMTGKLGDKKAAIQMLDQIQSRIDDPDKGSWVLGQRNGGVQPAR